MAWPAGYTFWNIRSAAVVRDWVLGEPPIAGPGKDSFPANIRVCSGLSRCSTVSIGQQENAFHPRTKRPQDLDNQPDVVKRTAAGHAVFFRDEFGPLIPLTIARAPRPAFRNAQASV